MFGYDAFECTDLKQPATFWKVILKGPGLSGVHVCLPQCALQHNISMPRLHAFAQAGRGTGLLDSIHKLAARCCESPPLVVVHSMSQTAAEVPPGLGFCHSVPSKNLLLAGPPSPHNTSRTTPHVSTGSHCSPQGCRRWHTQPRRRPGAALLPLQARPPGIHNQPACGVRVSVWQDVLRCNKSIKYTSKFTQHGAVAITWCSALEVLRVIPPCATVYMMTSPYATVDMIVSPQHGVNHRYINLVQIRRHVAAVLAPPRPCVASPA